MEEYLDLLNDSQREAVVYCDGASLVVAGAGSGKTRVLTYKIAYLIDHGLPPYSILALTFTNKAAREMKTRIAQITSEETAARLWMGTFHSIFSRILRREATRLGYTSNFTIYDATDSKSLVKSIVKDMGLDEKVYRPGTVQSAISKAKNALISPKAYASSKALVEADMRSNMPLIRDIYARYQYRCKQADAMDFDDLLMQTNVLFRDHPEVLAFYQERFRYVLVDEYQDTNVAQYLIVKQLTKLHGRVCVVGDDAQSIYSFRGANINNILDFKNQYPDTKVFKLEQNYRSTQTIVNAANSLIHKNERQIRKVVFSEKEVGSPIRVLDSYSDYEEAYAVAGVIQSLHRRFSFADIAILYRTNAQSRVLEEAFRKRSIPYKIYGGLSFYQRKEVKDVISYLRLIVNPNDEEALKRIINYPARGIGNTTIGKIMAAATDHEVSPWAVLSDPAAYSLAINGGTARKLAGFCELMDGFRKLDETESAEKLSMTVLLQSGIVAELSKDRSVEGISRTENIEELQNGITEYCEIKREEGAEQVRLSEFLSEVSLLTDQDNEKEENQDKVTLMTVHAAKGLEFPNVVIVGLEENLFPSSMVSSSPSGIEEERRLFYVAITRAEQNCFFSYAKSRFRNGKTEFCTPSRFLRDVDRRYMTAGELHEAPVMRPAAPAPAPAVASVSQIGSLSVGARVKHARFGEGVVQSLSGNDGDAKAVVEFVHFGIKQLLLKYAKLEVL